jgi:transcriptional antiterminator NusG
MSKKWYIVQTYSGQENSVKDALERRVKSMNFEDKIFQVLSPEETYEETRKDGKKVEKTRKIFPGYIFVEFDVEEGGEVDDRAWFMVRNTPGVTGFLGSSGKGTKPNPVRKSEMDAILMRIGKIEKPTLEFKVGDKVEIIAGPFKGQVCEVSAVNEANQTVTVLTEMFGRFTPNELDATEVKAL